MTRHFAVGIGMSIYCAAAKAADLEHWTCQERIGRSEYRQDYTLADNRMFAPKGKGSWPLIYNSDDVAVAYLRIPNGSATATHIYVLDKRANKLIWYDDTVPAALGKSAPQAEPMIQISACVRTD